MILGEHKGNSLMPAMLVSQAAPSRAAPSCATAPARPVQPHPVVYVVRGRPGPDDRPCLPPGHPDTWGRITEGTVLDSAPYPFPIFCS